MVFLIGGASHTGKTLLAQTMLERWQIPYLSLDHLKMGLIRSGQTDLTPLDDEALLKYLWPITREIVKTAVENHQHLVIEGCYIPFDWQKDFSDEYQQSIQYGCLIMTPLYIQNHYDQIIEFENVIEQRGGEDCSLEELIYDNRVALEECRKHNLYHYVIEESYTPEQCLTRWQSLMKQEAVV